MAILNQEALSKRASLLDSMSLNGIRMVLVRLDPVVNPTQAILTVQFYNNQQIASILADIAATPALAKQYFPIDGGSRISAGPATGQVQTTAVAGVATGTTLDLTVAPIGDYSVYTLRVEHDKFDPVFSHINFKFRPGCFNADCSPEWKAAPAPADDPAIDYLSKDFDSFRHTMIAAMMQRVPGWQPTSEADLDEVLLELFSAAADELSDYQDRVMNEAYLGSVRKRVSLARHARLVDYHVHQGNQASTTLALEVVGGTNKLPRGLRAWTGLDQETADSQVFMSNQEYVVDSLLNELGLYTWSDSAPALEVGATTADLRLLSGGGEADAVQIRDHINNGEIRQLLIQEWLNPDTGRAADANPQKRQLLTLLPNAAKMQDPVTAEWLVRVHWQDSDKLKFNYCFTIDCAVKVENVSKFHGNLVEVFHGIPRKMTFVEPGTPLADDQHRHFERPTQPAAANGAQRWGVLCTLPPEPLAYRNTPPGGDTEPQTTLWTDGVSDPSVKVDSETWTEVINFIHSDDTAANGSNYVVETDENQHSVIRFGNAVNGRDLPEGATVVCQYQSGFGLDGNVGADSIAHCTAPAGPVTVTTCWNPLDVTNGRAPESFDSVIRRAPEAYRFRQLRAVTLQDYVDRAEQLPEVSRAAASYAWTGSWRTVRVAIDPKGTEVLDDALRQKIESYLNAVRLLGEDLEVRPPLFVPLEIHVSVCINPDYWKEDLRFLLAQTFSSSYKPDGTLAFFHPDRWTFGQSLYRSQIEGALLAIEGVEHVVFVGMKRWNARGRFLSDVLEVGPNEIIEVLSDPDRMEHGYIDFDIQGGRQ